jgi:glycosyltransferase involved in cell wall biosynthesis
MVYGPDADAWTRLRRRVPLLRAPDLTGTRWLFISDAVRARAPVPGEVVRPGVDPAAFPFRPAGTWGWRLACIGRVEPRKGIAVAVEALAALPEATLTVDGPDEGHRADLEALAGRLGVAGRLRFTRTPADRVAGAYAAADAVLFPVTWPEPWGLVPLEAMSVGRPVVATGTGGSGEYLRDGENALLAAPGDAAALAAAVRRLAATEALRARLVAGGRATAAGLTQDAFQRRVIGALEAEAHRVRTPS